MEKQITLSLEQARDIYGKNPEMDKLLLSNFSKEELTRKSLPKTWNELKKVGGYYISANGKITSCFRNEKAIDEFRHRFYSNKEAESALAMAQLSQLMAVYNDGWFPNWNHTKEPKYCIFRNSCNELTTDYYYSAFHYLAFKSSEIRDEFLYNFEELIKDYFMLE